MNSLLAEPETELTPFRSTSSDLFLEDVDPKWLLVWGKIDTRDRGRVPLKDVEFFFLNSSYGDILPDENITSLLIKADENADGYLSKSEFISMMRQSKRRPPLQRAFRNGLFLAIPRSGRTAKVRRYIDEFSCLPPPVFMVTITLAEIAMFIYNAHLYGETITASGPIFWDSVLIYNPQKRYEAWRFISYIFIHAGWVHLVNNLVLQLILGVILELVHHWWRVMIVYGVGAVGGCLAASISNPSFFLAGASGGVYALEYSYIGNLVLNWPEMKFPIIQVVALGLISILDVGYALWDTFFSDTPSATSYMAHLGGAVTGVLIGVNVLRNLEKEPWEKYCWWICFVLLSALFTAAVLFHIFAVDYFPPSDRNL